MAFYREIFPTASVLPKMHMLVVLWLQKWHVGFGLLGEQGIESIHAHFNSLNRTYRSMPEEVARLRQLRKEHGRKGLMKTSPCLKTSLNDMHHSPLNTKFDNFVSGSQKKRSQKIIWPCVRSILPLLGDLSLEIPSRRKQHAT